MNPITRYPDVTWAAIAAELEREIHFRERTYDREITKGRMDPEAAKYQLAIARAWREDCHRFEQAHAPIAKGLPMQNPLQIPAVHGLDWQARRAGVQRELTYRARLYPVWIDKGNLTTADAARRTRALEAMLALYDEGLDFPGTAEDFAPYVADQILALQGDQQKELAL
ncbi:hypothetical protein [Novosphingobium sp.]|uniref:hypothetical protein n=1 Tax=Novosphingobium sp. TaxID=1874826 RepID=UPI00286E59B3|nr:hypothetical protein [Novosphingobium sp.]